MMAGNWDTGQLALFEALGEVVEKFGGDDAQDLANKITSKPTKEFINKIREAEENERIIETVQRILEQGNISMTDGFWDSKFRELVIKGRILDSLKRHHIHGDKVLDEVVAIYGEKEVGELAKEFQGLRKNVEENETALSRVNAILRPDEPLDNGELMDKLRDMKKKAEVLETFMPQYNGEWNPGMITEKLRDLKRRSGILDHVLACPDSELQRHVKSLREKLGVQYPEDSAGLADGQALIPRPDDVDEDQEEAANMFKSNNKASEEYRKKSTDKLKKVVDANRTLQSKLRQVADNRNRWSKYAEHLEKKLEKSNVLLKEHKLALPPSTKEATVDLAEVTGRPQTLERDVSVDVIVPAVDPNPYKETPDLAQRILEAAENSQQEAQAEAIAGRLPLQTERSLPENAMIEDGGLIPKAVQPTRDRLGPAPNGGSWHGDVEIPRTGGYDKHSAYWGEKGKGRCDYTGLVYSEDHLMAPGGQRVEDCNKDAPEMLGQIKPGEGRAADGKMKKALKSYKHSAPQERPAPMEQDTSQEPAPADELMLFGGRNEQAHRTSETDTDFISKLSEYHQQRGTIFDPRPNIGVAHIDLQKLYNAVIARGGYDKLSLEKMGWIEIASTFGLGRGNRTALQLRTVYYKYLAAYEIQYFHGKEPPPWEILEDVPLKTGPLLTRTFENFANEAQTMAIKRRRLREEAALKASKTQETTTTAPSATTSEPPPLYHSSSQSEPLSEPTLPKLPALIHAHTVPDSEASSSSLSAIHSSSTQAEHPISGADTINAAEANEAATLASTTLPPTLPHPSSDDAPVVVSARRLRKRGRNGSSPAKKKIKQERLESSPIALLGLRHLQTQESMDLDEIGPKTATPKKRRYRKGGVEGWEEYVPMQDMVYEHPPDFMSRDDGESGTPGTPVGRPSLPGTPIVPAGATSVLRPRSINTPTLPRTSAKLRFVKQRKDEDTEKGAQLFSEDGENHLAPDDTEVVKNSSRVQPAVRATRLSNMLEKPGPRRWQVMNMDDMPDGDDSAIAGLESAVKPRQPVNQGFGDGSSIYAAEDDDSDDDLPTMEEVIKREPSDLERHATSLDEMKANPIMRPNGPIYTPLARSDVREAMAAKGHKVAPLLTSTTLLNKYGRKVREDVLSTARPDGEPLATRPVSRLSLEDFRINPEYNNGLDYAYRDVVRGRVKRKCLAGCTDPSCCGKGFRALAEIATPVREHVTTAQKEEEDKLLKEFIGRDAERLMRQMNKEERRETLLKAKTRELANKHGKHRHAYERRKSPPGFWRTDFPTTQEEAEDREKAKQFERDLVQKRYEEAMRGDGKWIFKDQKGGQPPWVGN